MAAGTHNITIEQGATFDLVATYTDAAGDIIPLTGWTGRMQVRATKGNPHPILSLPGSDGTITITGSLGRVAVSIPATVTAEIPTYGKDSAVFYYDLELVETATGRVVRLIQGTVTVDAEVTR